MFTSTINDSDMEQLRGFKKAGGTVSKMTQRHAFFGWDPMTPRAVGRLEVAANGGAFANCTGIVYLPQRVKFSKFLTATPQQA
ncbi:hypothetical protein D5086_016159 [Populus alba]|uniref:Uncharacterized protein n=1 Tax=Populus alba TaxID=43335 RepID=A0ACC4BUL6_POPAL